jgi:hypothetical protein
LKPDQEAHTLLGKNTIASRREEEAFRACAVRLVATNRALFCWQCFSDLGPVLLDYLHCLCQCRQFGWHCLVPFIGLDCHHNCHIMTFYNHNPHFSVLATRERGEAHCQFALADGAVCIGGKAVSKGILIKIHRYSTSLKLFVYYAL